MLKGFRIVNFNNGLLNEAEKFLFSLTNSVVIVADADCEDVHKLLYEVKQPNKVYVHIVLSRNFS